MALAIDGTGSTISSPNTGAGESISVSLTTSFSNDIILVYWHGEYPSVNNANVTSVTASGLTFQRRWAYDNSGMSTAGTQQQELWWAVATNPFSGLITLNVSGSIDDANVIAFGVSGANVSNPWDSNSSLPAKLGYNVGGANISTNSSSGMVLAFWGSPGYNASTAPQPTGLTNMTSLVNTSNTGGQWFEYGFTAYATTYSAVNNIFYGWTGWTPIYGSPGGNSSYTVLDALQAPNPAPTTPTIGTVTVINSSTISIPFTGGTNATSFTGTATSSSGPITLSISGTSSPLVATGSFSYNSSYYVAITATNTYGSATSGNSNTIIPINSVGNFSALGFC